MIGLINCSEISRKEKTLTSMIKIAGITILERQVRIMRRLEIKKIVLIVKSDKEKIEKEIKKFSFKNVDIKIATATEEGKIDSPFFAETSKPLLYFDGCSIFDERLPERFYEIDRQLAALIPEETLLINQQGKGVKITTDNKDFRFTGIAAVSAKSLKSIDMTKESDISKEVVKNIIKETESPILDISELSTYNYDLRRDQSYTWIYIESHNDNHRAKKELLNNAQKSVLDWPAWFIHRPIEKWITYHICEWSITPNQITLINIVVAFIATYFFATGNLLPAMIFAIATGIIDGLDGKQARVKIMMSKIGKLEEVSDRIYEYSWYLAMAYFLVKTGHGTVPYVLFGFLFVFHALDVAVSAIFKFKRHVQLDDFGQLERNFRWIGSRRNTNVWTLIPFVLFGYLYEGLIFITVYYGITITFKIWRATVHLSKESKRKAV